MTHDIAFLRCAAALALAALACSSAAMTDADYRVRRSCPGCAAGSSPIWRTWSPPRKRCRRAAPTPAGRGWDATQDAAAIAAMKSGLGGLPGTAYEHIEGATAPIFPDVDATIDARYDGLSGRAARAATRPVRRPGRHRHARRRADPLRRRHAGARGRSTNRRCPDTCRPRSRRPRQQASAFKTGWSQKLIDDAQTLHDQWEAATNYDLDAAFSGLIALDERATREGRQGFDG